MPVRGEQQLMQLRHRTRQVAGLLGFPARQQAEVAVGVAAYAAAALELSGELLVEFQVDDRPARQRLIVAMEFEGDAGEFKRPDTGMVEQTEIRLGTGGRTTIFLAREFPGEAPAAAGETLAMIAGELAKRNRPGASPGAPERRFELSGAAGELGKVHRELQGYARDASRDLRAPLTEMLLANEALRKKLEDEGREASDAGLRMLLDAVSENVERSVTLIDGLLALSEAGQAPAEVADVSVARTVELVVREHRILLEQRKARVEAGDNLGTVRASPTHVYQVFSNLICDAVRHNDLPEPVVEVLRTPADGREPTFVVRDNSPAAPGAVPGFIPFFNGRSGDMGIGLAIVEKIVNLYGGRLELSGDGGACYRFSMPGL